MEFWNAYNGVMAVANDDAVEAYAHLDYLRCHGYPCFHSFEEIELTPQNRLRPRPQAGAPHMNQTL